MLYVLAFPRFSRTDKNSIETFRRRWEPERAAMVPAHLTLVFATSKVGLADLSALCARVAHETSTIAIELAPPVTTLDVIESVKRIEFPVSEHANEIFALHTRLYDGPHSADYRDDIPYRPHITIGLEEGRGRGVDEARQTFQDKILADLDEISLVRSDRDRIECLQTFPLRPRLDLNAPA